ncbi:DNA-binding transcriptional LysR family regulator [Rhodobium orientis]|uniref:LysR family transcriptional regulator n=1 Tax=Rhodobium orientis TaxID=34017 RepID=A0A327JT67_9HYPH|nr:LysR family transcriptional regulator [Rhodobium orientis]MBB4304693.1 DNA-binding transcriptional LysR family regulator [Rhodobium orientis]MBK5952102.1 LysR family transcriptional regulator [Rhodobium orientis]RAI26498.1 LysR family transcriptional regulator [Rhodobium orientis]
MDTLTRMRIFVQVVESGGFSAAARALGRSKALVSKYVRELEDELGVRLLNRTTRQLSLTEMGETYVREASEIIQKIEDLNGSLGERHGEPRGLLRVSAPRSFGELVLAEPIMEFLATEPQIRISLRFEDRYVDLVEEGIDVAIRISELADSSLVARRLAPMRNKIVAAPLLLDASGRPQHPKDLADLPCIIDRNMRVPASWTFREDGKRFSVSVSGPAEVDSLIAVRAAALRGLGFASVPEFVARDDIASGALVEVLGGFQSDDIGVYALYPHRRHLPGKVRAFIDFLAAWFGRDWPRSAD